MRLADSGGVVLPFFTSSGQQQAASNSLSRGGCVWDWIRAKLGCHCHREQHRTNTIEKHGYWDDISMHRIQLTTANKRDNQPSVRSGTFLLFVFCEMSTGGTKNPITAFISIQVLLQILYRLCTKTFGKDNENVAFVLFSFEIRDVFPSSRLFPSDRVNGVLVKCAICVMKWMVDCARICKCAHNLINIQPRLLQA